MVVVVWFCAAFFCLSISKTFSISLQFDEMAWNMPQYSSSYTGGSQCLGEWSFISRGCSGEDIHEALTRLKDSKAIRVMSCAILSEYICFIFMAITEEISFSFCECRRSLITLKGRCAVWPSVQWRGWWLMFGCLDWMREINLRLWFVSLWLLCLEKTLCSSTMSGRDHYITTLNLMK